MNGLRLSDFSISKKVFVTSMILMIGLIYITLVLQKWIDTGMWAFKVAEGYQYMEYIELTDQAHIYLPYYSLFIFAIPVVLLMLTSFSSLVKCFFAVFPFVIIAIDTASTFLIPYVWEGFAMLLWTTGTLLGISLAVIFVMLFFDLWIRKAPTAQVA